MVAIGQVEGTKRCHPEGHVREADAGTPNEFRDEINAGDVQSLPLQKVGPVPGAAAGVEHWTGKSGRSKSPRPPFDTTAVQLAHVLYGAKKALVLCSPGSVGMEHFVIGHAASLENVAPERGSDTHDHPGGVCWTANER